MRPDIHKVICECYRYGSKNAKALRTKLKRQPDLTKVSMKARRWREQYKEFGENLNPLLRFLEKQVGKSWDKTYSELRKAIPHNTLGDHVMLHVRQYVDTTGDKSILRIAGWPRFYVDKHGILRKNKEETYTQRRRRLTAERKLHKLIFTFGNMYVSCEENIWYVQPLDAWDPDDPWSIPPQDRHMTKKEQKAFGCYQLTEEQFIKQKTNQLKRAGKI